MKQFLRRIFLLAVGVFIGFALGRGTAPKPDTTTLRAVAVDCYDSQGNFIPDQFEKYGARMGCAPGQTAKLHQPPAH